MRKIRFTEHQIIAVLKSVETGRAVHEHNNAAQFEPCLSLLLCKYPT